MEISARELYLTMRRESRSPQCICMYYYMAKASGRYNACSDWLRARSKQGSTHP